MILTYCGDIMSIEQKIKNTSEIVFTGKTNVKDNYSKAELTIDAFVKFDNDIYRVGDYIGFIYHDDLDLQASEGYIFIQEIAGKIMSIHYKPESEHFTIELADVCYRRRIDLEIEMCIQAGVKSPFPANYQYRPESFKSDKGYYNSFPPAFILNPKKINENEYRQLTER